MRPALAGLRVHVEGMGVTGSLLAYHLEKLGANWTWHDKLTHVTAWRACTGAIYPAGAPGSLDDQCYRVWDRWLNAEGEELCPYPRKFFEQAAYWFSTKQPPHGGRYVFHGPTKHKLSNAGPVSYHLNAQTFVPYTRHRFGERNSKPPQRFDAYIVAHGFGARLKRVVWGWTVPVQLAYDRHVYGTGGCRPCFYFREGRFVMAYAYPIPGTNLWYAGSSLIPQREPHELEVEAKFHRWQRTFERLSHGAVKVRQRRGAPLQGWRPSEGGAHAQPVVKRWSKHLAVPPLWHSGIRHFPTVLDQVRTKLLTIKEER